MPVLLCRVLVLQKRCHVVAQGQNFWWQTVPAPDVTSTVNTEKIAANFI